MPPPVGRGRPGSPVRFSVPAAAVPWILVAFFLVATAALAAGLWAWVLADVLRHEPNDGWGKLLWTYFVLLLVPPVGAALYLLVRRPERLREYGE